MDAFVNRLRKNHQHRKKWAARQHIEAYRVYDEDIPEHPFIVDIYLDHAVIYDRRRFTKEETEEESKTVRADVEQAVGSALEFLPKHLHFKERRQKLGRVQNYNASGTSEHRLTVREETTNYLVNLSDYLDTGLFLDHRPLRSQFRRGLQGKRLLNLFCYTGSISAAAAQGGAATTNVDLSKTYLDWAEDIFRANKLSTDAHEFIRYDAREFLAEGPGMGEAFDIVFLDPPTFSNSKKMAGNFDIQRDHAQLIIDALAFLKKDGVLYFSTNRSKFHLDDRVLKHANAKNITNATIPEDFRNRKAHHCYEFRKSD